MPEWFPSAELTGREEEGEEVEKGEEGREGRPQHPPAVTTGPVLSGSHHLRLAEKRNNGEKNQELMSDKLHAKMPPPAAVRTFDARW